MTFGSKSANTETLVPTGSSPITGIGLAWAITGLIHLLTFQWTLPTSWSGAVFCFSTILLLFKPSSFRHLTIFLASVAILLGLNYENASNHLVLEFWISASSLLSISYHFLIFDRTKRRELSILSIAAFARLQYLLIFFFAVLSKLNSDFFDPDWSCASLFAKQTIEFLKLDTISFGLLDPSRESIRISAIYLTLTCEIAIPCLLIAKKTRRLGIYVALAFHFAMGFIPILGISSFSSLSFTLLLFFFPRSALSLLDSNISSIVAPFRRRRATKAACSLIVLLTLSLAIYLHQSYFHPAVTPIAKWLWLSLSLPLLWLAFRALRATHPNRQDQEPAKDHFLPQPRTLASLNLPVVILGLLPYLGLQTQGSFTMFSNLRILGAQPNLFLANGPLLESNLELIEVLSSNHPEFESYPNSNKLITSHEFRRKAPRYNGDFHILCEYQGEIILIGRFEGQLTPHPLLLPLSPAVTRWIRFRDVSTNEHCECAW
ncbi:HTTM domain-containing protein [Pelagicoccus albus]|uniref:HTTM domain-containing protein n=1 Tax=Pelagicoccus albus TaxID=415222 RepID=A0A7X1B6R7_9BACT|nr:HTTM domain-containing protein [Pelagicoccus albus]MBC2606687.1 HTTM domain-containing protein [Pelagicoccus albus]